MLIFFIHPADAECIDGEKRISQRGARELGERIVVALARHIVAPLTLRLLCANVPEARDTASMLLERLRRRETPELHTGLWIDSERPCDLEAAFGLLAPALDGAVDVVAVIAHPIYLEHLPVRCGQVLKGSVPEKVIGSGQARLIYAAEPERLVILP